MIKPPIACVEGYDIIVFPSVEDAEGFIEPIDTQCGETYDSDGHLLKMEVGFVERQRRLLWFKWKQTYKSTIISENIPAVDRSEELKKKLTAYLIQKGESVTASKNATLEELINSAGKYMPWSKKFENPQ